MRINWTIGCSWWVERSCGGAFENSAQVAALFKPVETLHGSNEVWEEQL